MGQIMSLDEVMKKLSQFDRDDTIYASEPWTGLSDAIVAQEPGAGGLPPEAVKGGMMYFLEVFIAQQVVEDWIASLKHIPAQSLICQRVIDYAINDA